MLTVYITDDYIFVMFHIGISMVAHKYGQAANMMIKGSEVNLTLDLPKIKAKQVVPLSAGRNSDQM